jgi:glucokinase
VRRDAVIAVDLGATKLASALFSAQGKILSRAEVHLNGARGKAVGRLVMDAIKGHLSEAGKQRVGGIGVCVPGIADERGVVWAPNIPGWTRYPLRAELRRRFASMTVTVRSDRTCYILGEAWKGAARNCHDVVFVAVGTGIGAGILVNGDVVEGAQGVAGAIGWMALQPPWIRKYKACGCFEYSASGAGLARYAKELSKRAMTARDVVSLYDSSRVAKQTVNHAIEFWGMAVANLVSIFNPQKIIFGGGVFGPAKRFLPMIRREARKWAQPIAFGRVQIVASELGGDAGLYGAAVVARESLELVEKRLGLV